MERVGVRELKNHLSRYLNTVQQGRNVLVTVRGKPVARLIPVSPPATTSLLPELEERMWELVANGFLTWSGRSFQMPEPVGVNKGPGLFSDLVVEDRE
jgi:prevent-host-death family protein